MSAKAQPRRRAAGPAAVDVPLMNGLGVSLPIATFPTVECHCDGLDSLELHGWAFDRADIGRPAVLHILVDGQEVGQVLCGDPRPDVQAAGIGPEHVGYHFTPPSFLADGEPHRLELRDRWRREVTVVLQDKPVPAIDFTITFTPRVASFVDGLRNGAFGGWVMKTELNDPHLHGDCLVRVACDGTTIGHVRANFHRGDVGRALQGTVNCGFQFIPPAHVRSSRPRSFAFYVMPENIELVGSPYVTSLVANAEEARLLDLVDAIDGMHRELTRIRRQVREMLPRPGHSIAAYDLWFGLYEPALRQRIAAQRPDNWASGPLVSVVCPVYRPLPEDFRAAVESVLAQSYRNWELILVDDGSRAAALSAMLAEFAAADPRIRVIVRKKNKGISEATNAALLEARGEWVAFFDHDDALVDCALECMVGAALRTGARVLYSDEDKVDSHGQYSAPAFKPDWNHRMMLGVNYVCHLLFVQKALLDAAGPLTTRHNGAQDHDLILRLSERIGPHEIHHVPEVLYHWRITASSTAAAGSNKAYAAAAGALAVSEHLERIGRPAIVESIDQMTLYKVRWTVGPEPRVTVIIPFKDQIATTEQCLKALRERTAYRNYDVILVDNWTTVPQLTRLQRAVASQPDVRLIRMEQDFNFSRLNNQAVAMTDAEFYVFMNNDLFVTDPGWLHAAVNEAMVDPSVGAVGGKFFYPDGTIQHAGVVLGLGGVAGHAHVGLSAGDNGYGHRALFTQEMSAVTAAGMLVRATAFHEVGGFDEKQLRVAFNDIDLCLKLRRAGYKVIWSPDFVADHHESLSRGDDERPAQESRFFEEVEVMKERWGETLRTDPFYHPKFSLERQAFFDLVDPA